MSGFQAVNTTLLVPEHPPARLGEETTPTTPRPNKFFAEDARGDEASAKTPTRNSFGLSAQRPLPSSPFTPAREVSKTPSRNGGQLSRENSHRSTHSVDSQDVEMGDEDDGHDGSDGESVSSDTTRPSKKKKGQRFFCTDFPPCQLSFTRSEHLARHIRKHTGERPFQCHCSRRFSRLDNLRQHAQTVHVNEDIPGDSLAATGTRFQRQIRTDRVRPPGSRSRANTLGSQGGHSRGHSRNLSSSSITSTTSTISTVSTPQDSRRRPPPLAMANDGAARARLSLETYNPPLMGSPGPQYTNYGNQSPGVTTPTSATFSASGSPNRFPSGLQSPISTVPRSLTWGSRTPGRRLSVPSGANPFQGPQGSIPAPLPYLTPMPSSTSSTFSANNSLFASPTSSVFSESRRESNASESDWRRRTWHPGTYSSLGPRPATSGLSYYQTPDAPHPSFSSQPAASQTTRLPGIESFDHAPPPLSLARRPSPMQIDPPSRSAFPSMQDQARAGDRTSISWDSSLQKGLNRLDITSPTPPRETQGWSHYQGPQSQATSVRPTTAPHTGYYSYQASAPIPQQAQAPPREDRLSQEQPVTPRKNKRHGWYNGPLPQSQPAPSQAGRTIQRTSPEDSSSSEGVPTPSTSSLAEYHPAIVHSNGYIEAHPPGVPVDEHKPTVPQPVVDRGTVSLQTYPTAGPPPQRAYQVEHDRMGFGQRPHDSHPGANDMRRLDVLVAVATGEQAGVPSRP
ncbi:hypothetical protein BU16DRAFT_391310 [Lophium mytilinum]|uniref:C2H2-type domain-containing protein n=1 Tax=Lophium mytilinum TaxID=390894 RepID=A0A6A6QWW4_9PEZI|nr:hypothetical protein BU16DRAFT_391310 [Lophium mytilinum]